MEKDEQEQEQDYDDIVYDLRKRINYLIMGMSCNTRTKFKTFLGDNTTTARAIGPILTLEFVAAMIIPIEAVHNKEHSEEWLPEHLDDLALAIAGISYLKRDVDHGIPQTLLIQMASDMAELKSKFDLSAQVLSKSGPPQPNTSIGSNPNLPYLKRMEKLVSEKEKT